MRSQLLAWSAHAYTGLGLVCAAAIAALIVAGSPGSFRLAFVLMVVATFIDATDGVYARRVRVHDVTPQFDGRRLDDLIDFLTYTCLPLLLIWRADLLGRGSGWWLLLPLVASAYGFCQVNAKTADHFFLGFPSYWNIVALYLFLLRLPPPWALALIVALAVLTFVPLRYLYPTRGGPAARATILLGGIWAISLVVILWQWERAAAGLVIGSLYFPAYYLAASWYVSLKRVRRQPGM